MSVLSKVLKKLKPLGKVVNKVTDLAAPVVGYIPGVGPIAAGAIDAAGDLAGGHNLKSAIGSGLKTGGTAYIGGKLAAKLGGKLAPIAGKAAAGAIGGKKPDLEYPIGQDPVTGEPIFPSDVAKSAGGGGSSILDKLAPIGRAITGQGKPGSGGIDWGSLLGTAGKLALPAAGAYMASKNAGKADDYRNKAINIATAEWNAGAPLRDLGRAGLMNTTPVDVSSIFNKPRPQYSPVVI